MACATVNPPTLPKLSDDKNENMRLAYAQTKSAYTKCINDYEEKRVPYQTYISAGSGLLSVALLASAAGVGFSSQDESVTGASVAGLGLLSVASAGVATYFGAQIPPAIDAREGDLVTLKAAAVEIENAAATDDDAALAFLARQLYEDCRAIHAARDADQAGIVLNDLQGYRKDLLNNLATLREIQESSKGLEGENGKMAKALQNARIDAEKLGRRVAALDSESAEREAKINAMRSQIKSLEDDRAKLSARERKLLDEKRKLEEKTNHYEDVAAALKQELESGRVALRKLRDGIVVEMPNKVLFPSGKATLNEAGKETLAKVADAIKTIQDKRIRVEGHTDNVPVGKGLAFVDNWELSTERALTVTRFLQEGGVSSNKLSAEGRSEYAPVASNESDEGRAKNRRIEIYLVAPQNAKWSGDQ